MNNHGRISWPRIIKFGISLFVFAFSAIRGFWTRLLGGTRKASCVILYYHSVPPGQRTAFASQLDLLLRFAEPIDLSGNANLIFPTHHVGITFDDAFENFSEVAVPELKARRIPATIFVISNAIGRLFGDPENPEKTMSLEQLEDLPRDLVTIGSHTSTHPFLPAISRESALQELVNSRLELERILNREVTMFSFPFGGFTEDLVMLAHEAGYKRVFTTQPNLAFVSSDEFAVGRVRVDPTDWPLEYRLKLAGAYRWLPWAFALKRRLRSNRTLAKFLPKKLWFAEYRVPRVKIY
jgi:peptidoglycan/xylan/chitin deacetylase (PgdA/CDA1 family)